MGPDTDMGPGGLATPNRAGVCGRPPTNRPLLAVREDGGVYSPSLRSRAVRLPPTPCRVCFRPCVFNKFSHFWQKERTRYSVGRTECKQKRCLALGHQAQLSLSRPHYRPLHDLTCAITRPEPLSTCRRSSCTSSRPSSPRTGRRSSSRCTRPRSSCPCTPMCLGLGLGLGLGVGVGLGQGLGLGLGCYVMRIVVIVRLWVRFSRVRPLPGTPRRSSDSS